MSAEVKDRRSEGLAAVVRGTCTIHEFLVTAVVSGLCVHAGAVVVILHWHAR